MLIENKGAHVVCFRKTFAKCSATASSPHRRGSTVRGASILRKLAEDLRLER